jgi:protein TonB
MSNQSTPPLPQGAQAGAGPGGGGIPQNSGKGQISADATSGTDVSGTVFGSQNPSGGGSGNYGNVQFGGPNGPQFLHREIPEYPLYARRRRKEGKVLLLLHVTEQGRLTSVEVVEASDPVFIGPSLKAVKKSTFTPAIRNGAYVAVKTLLPIRFVLDEEISTAQLRNN